MRKKMYTELYIYVQYFCEMLSDYMHYTYYVSAHNKQKYFSI